MTMVQKVNELEGIRRELEPFECEDCAAFGIGFACFGGQNGYVPEDGKWHRFCPTHTVERVQFLSDNGFAKPLSETGLLARP